MSTETTSHRQILKSSAIIGGSSVASIAFGVIRTKIMAVWLGPSGIGLLGIFDAIIQFARTFATLGVENSGVRQIAEASGKGDEREVALTIRSLRRACVFLGTLGALALFFARGRVSQWSFGDQSHAGAIGWLSLAVFFGVISAGQSALLQGMRQIWSVAMIKIAGAASALMLCVPIVYWWGLKGIIPYLLTVYGSAFLVSWWYARKISAGAHRITLRQQGRHLRTLAKWGFVFLISASMATFIFYVSRALVSRYMGLAAVGQFQAAVALSSIYVGFILGAMGTDFYPMLTARADDNAVCNKLVNEQLSISLLIGIPGILATVVFGDMLIQLLYSGKFLQAADILFWQMPGVLLRTASWPIGIALAAKGRSNAFLAVSVISGTVEIVLISVLTRMNNLPLVGLASTASCAVAFVLATVLLTFASGFKWTALNVGLLLLGLAGIAIGCAIDAFLSGVWRGVAGIVLVMTSTWFCAQKTAELTGHGTITGLLRDLQIRVEKKLTGGLKPSGA